MGSDEQQLRALIATWKVGGRWLLARDANMLSPVQG